MTQYQAELYHHGVLGQKWGVRRYQNKDGSYTNAGKAHRSSSEGKNQNGSSEKKTIDGKKIAAVAGAVALTAAAAYAASNPDLRKAILDTVKSASNPKKMSESELKSAIERLELEKKYITLSKETVSSGKAFTRDVLTSIGKKTLTQLGVGAAIAGAATVAKKYDAKKYVPDAKNQW